MPQVMSPEAAKNEQAGQDAAVRIYGLMWAYNGADIRQSATHLYHYWAVLGDAAHAEFGAGFRRAADLLAMKRDAVEVVA